VAAGRIKRRVGRNVVPEVKNWMRIEASQKIAGFPAIQVRLLMRRVGAFRITPIGAGHILGCTADQALRLLRDLGKGGYTSSNDGQYWEVTDKGTALASATAAKPLRRVTVDRLISELLDRVREVNQDDQWAYRVETVVIFGSALTSKLRPSDVDVACSFRPRWRDARRQRLHEEQRRELRRSPFASTIQLLYWPQFEVVRFLKSRSRGLSIHRFDEWVRQNTKYKVLYERRTRPVDA
jgi:predicted nucleotidyltransferase